MEFTIKTGNPAKLKTGLLVLGAFADGKLPALGGVIDDATQGRLSSLLERGDLEDKAGSPCCSTSSRARTPNACWW